MLPMCVVCTHLYGDGCGDMLTVLIVLAGLMDGAESLPGSAYARSCLFVVYASVGHSMGWAW
jgi:hypothetical protein